MNTIQAAIAEIVAEALRDAADDIESRNLAHGGKCCCDVCAAFTECAQIARSRADRVAAGLTP